MIVMSCHCDYTWLYDDYRIMMFTMCYFSCFEIIFTTLEMQDLASPNQELCTRSASWRVSKTKQMWLAGLRVSHSRCKNDLRPSVKTVYSMIIWKNLGQLAIWLSCPRSRYRAMICNDTCSFHLSLDLQHLTKLWALAPCVSHIPIQLSWWCFLTLAVAGTSAWQSFGEKIHRAPRTLWRSWLVSILPKAFFGQKDMVDVGHG